MLKSNALVLVACLTSMLLSSRLVAASGVRSNANNSQSKMNDISANKFNKPRETWVTCTAEGERVMDIIRGGRRDIVKLSDEDNRKLKELKARLLEQLEAVNEITRAILGKPAPSGPVLQATILAGCPRNDGEDPNPNGMLEIAQAPLENESADYFLKLDGIDGESGGGSGGSGGCYDEDAGVCCAGPCPC